MVNGPEKSENKDSLEAKAEEELLKLGVQSVPENIRAVLDQQKIPQHPAGYEDVVNPEDLVGLEKAMREKGIKRVVHFEGPSLWIHSKLAMVLVQFMNIPEEEKADLKLILLYHDLGKAVPGVKDRPANREILQKELRRGKLYQPAKGHANEGLRRIEAGFMANGISGRELEIFMTVVRNHMNHLDEMGPQALVRLIEGLGRNDEERKEVARLLAFTQQADSNATAYADLCPDGEVRSLKEPNTTGIDFDEIWARYLEGKK